MITGELKIGINADFDDYASFDVTASRGTLAVHVHFWAQANLFEQFGAQLASFPQSQHDRVEIEIGEMLPGVSPYLFLEAYCYDTNGHAALKIVTHNNASEPQAQRVEFSIPADVASLNALGRLLANWPTQGSLEVGWQAQIS
jgi:hypothetical protein